MFFALHWADMTPALVQSWLVCEHTGIGTVVSTCMFSFLQVLVRLSWGPSKARRHLPEV